MANYAAHFTIKPLAITAAVAAALALTAFTGIGQAHAAEPGDDDFLGTAETFVIIAANTVTDADPVAPSEVHGDVALTSVAPGAMELDTADVINGTIYVDSPTPDPVAMQAIADLGVAYGLVAAVTPTEGITGNLALDTDHLVSGEYVYEPGVYNSGSTILLDGNIVLDGLSDLDSVFIFQAGSALNVMSNSHITYRNGAQACNVYWQVGSSATIGTNAEFVGTILAATSIWAQTGATIDGQLLSSALNAGEVTLDNNVINGQTLCIRSSTTGTATTGTTTTTTARVDGVTTTSTTSTPPIGTTTGTTGTTTTSSSTGSTSRSTLAFTGNRTLANTGVSTAGGSSALLAGLLALGLGAMLVIAARRETTTTSTDA